MSDLHKTEKHLKEIKSSADLSPNISATLDLLLDIYSTEAGTFRIFFTYVVYMCIVCLMHRDVLINTCILFCYSA